MYLVRPPSTVPDSDKSTLIISSRQGGDRDSTRRRFCGCSGGRTCGHLTAIDQARFVFIVGNQAMFRNFVGIFRQPQFDNVVASSEPEVSIIPSSDEKTITITPDEYTAFTQYQVSRQSPSTSHYNSCYILPLGHQLLGIRSYDRYI